MLDSISWSAAGTALAAAFLASLVEAIEAFTVVLAASTIRGWRPAATGAAAGLFLLAVLVALFGPALSLVPLKALQLVIGMLLLLFGTRWLQKAILRAAGLIPERDEAVVFARQRTRLQDAASQRRARFDWIAGVTAFKAVVLEGLEVVFIVIAVGAGPGLILPASAGALGACLLVLALGTALRRPLAQVPENLLKFGVGIMLTAFGLFWTGEGLGISWPGGDLILIGLIVLLLLVSLATIATQRRARLRL